MDATLATVTVISLLLAWAMAIVTWQRIRAERRLSEARLATLAAEIAGHPAGRLEPMEPPERPWPVAAPASMAGRPSPRRRRAPAEPRLPFAPPAPSRAGRHDIPHWTGTGDEAARHGAERRHGATRRDLARGLAARSLSYLRGAVLAPMPPARTHWLHRVAAVAIATVLVAGVSLGELAPLHRDGAAVPVELLSLDHLRQGDYLAVSGSLRNPPGGKGRERLSVSATVFDRTGAVIGTGQTPLPVAVLPPGGETAFTISLPDADLIDRYRVSFMEDRSRLPHVDRRGTDAATPAAGPRP